MNKTNFPENKKNRECFQINDDLISGFLNETASFFALVNKLSTKINELEQCLSDRGVYIPFSLLIKEEPESLSQDPKDYHIKNTNYELKGYRTKKCWYLCWDESGQKSKKYRLYLVAKEKEIIFYSNDPEDLMSCGSREFKSTVVYKQIFIETDLPTRIKNAEHLDDFFVGFTEFLKKIRVSIESGEVDASIGLLISK